MPAVRPHWITHPWSRPFLGGCAVRAVEAPLPTPCAPGRAGATFGLGDVLERNPHLLLELLRKHYGVAFARLEEEILQLRVEDAFGRWHKRIGVRRRAAYEAMLLADDPTAMRAAYDYASTEYQNLSDRRIVRKLERKVTKLHALTAKLVANAKRSR
jgi:hypothetical protein